VTITAEIQGASTAPMEGRLARQFLSYDCLKHIQAATPLPFEVDDYFSDLDVSTSQWGNYVALDPLSMQVLSTPTTAKIIRHRQMLPDIIITRPAGRFGYFASIFECKMIAGDPMQSIYRFISMDDQTTDPSPIALILDVWFGKPKADDPLEMYEQYSKPNWDGSDAKPITAETLRYARWLLSLIPDTFGPPDIAPSADGSIGLEWVPESGSLRKLFLDIGPGQKWRAYWSRQGGEFGRQPGTSFNPNTKSTLQKLFNDLSS
jgi:hypothetical protein